MAVATSANYNKIIVLPGGKRFHSGAHVDFADGTSIEMDDRNIMEGYPAIDDKVSEEGQFELGGAYSSLLTLKLNNFEKAFSGYNFKGATIKPWIGLTTAVHWRDGEIVEKIQRGVFNVDSSPETNNVITITAYDNLAKLDVAYSAKSSLAYPATLAQIVADACSACGVDLATAAFPNSDYSVSKRPDSETITCREIIKYAAQLAGCFAKCNRNGEVEIRWYEEPEHVFDIGKNAVSYNVATSDTTITGVQIEGNDDSNTIYKAGTDDFPVRIKDNPLAQDGLQSLANSLETQLVGKAFRSYSVSAPMNPAVETGDIVNLTDKKGITHKTIVSGLQITFGDSEQYLGDAESTDENQSERFTAAEKAQSSANKAQQTANEASTGVEEAKTEIKQLNGEITLKADKGKLIAEINISPETIKISADKLELNGLVTIQELSGSGTTTINGDNITTGTINADLITAGTIQSKNGGVYFDLDNNELAVETLQSSKYPDTYMMIGRSVIDSGKYPAIGIMSGSTTPFIVIRDMPSYTQIISPNNLQMRSSDSISISAEYNVNIIGSVNIDGGDITVNGYTGETHDVKVMGAGGDSVGLSFKNGLFTGTY